jgi:hypothetical protein
MFWQFGQAFFHPMTNWLDKNDVCRVMFIDSNNTTLVVIETDCTGSCKYNYHAITTTTAL